MYMGLWGMMLMNFIINVPLLQMLHIKFGHEWYSSFREEAQNIKMLTHHANDSHNQEAVSRLSDPVGLKVWGRITLKSQNTAKKENNKIYY